jgi:tetratricopeptide (TPR) repeat protein
MSIAGRLTDALSILEGAATEYEDLAGSIEYVQLMAERARNNLLLGRSSTALQLVDATIETAERLELSREVLELLVTRGAALAQVARIHEAIVTLLGAVTFARSHEMTAQEFRARVNLSYAASAEDTELAFRIAREGYERAYQIGNRGQGMYLLGNASDAAMQLGNWDWALEQTSQAITGEQEDDYVARRHNLRVRGLRGESVDAELDELRAPLAGALEGQAISILEDARSDVLLSRGEFAEAQRLAVSSYARGPAPDNPSLIRAGRLACWMGDVSGAHAALDLMAAMTGRVVAAGRSETEAGLAALEGREADAVAGFVEAMRQWRELGARYALAVAGLGMVTMLGGHHPEARQAADEALEIFKSLAAEPFLRLLDSALVSERRPAPVRPIEPVKPSPTEGVPATG